MIAGSLALVLILGIVLSDGTLFAARTQQAEEAATAADLPESSMRPMPADAPRRLGDIQSVYQAITDGDYEKALLEVRICLLETSEDDPLREDLLMKLACLLSLRKDYDGAKKAFAKLNEQYPENTEGWLLNAQLHLDTEAPEHALTCLKRYMSLEPEDHETARMTAQLAFEQADYEAAATYYRRLLRGLAGDDPDQAEIRFRLGITLLQMSEHEEALQHFKALLDANAEMADIDYYCGICQLSLGQYEQAVDYFTTAIENGSFLQRSRYARGVAELLTEAANEEQALADLQLAAKYAEADADPVISAQVEDIIASIAAKNN